MESKRIQFFSYTNKFDWFCSGMLIIFVAAIWYFFHQPMIDIPGMGTLSAKESAGKLERPIYISLGLVAASSLLGFKSLVNLATGGMVGFFISVALRALERLERILLEIEDESIRATVNNAKILPSAYILASLIFSVVIVSLIRRRRCISAAPPINSPANIKN